MTQENAAEFLEFMAEMVSQGMGEVYPPEIVPGKKVECGHLRWRAEETLKDCWIVIAEENFYEGGWKTRGIMFSYNSREI